MYIAWGYGQYYKFYCVLKWFCLRVFKFTKKIIPVILGAEVENCLFTFERQNPNWKLAMFILLQNKFFFKMKCLSSPEWFLSSNMWCIESTNHNFQPSLFVSFLYRDQFMSSRPYSVEAIWYWIICWLALSFSYLFMQTKHTCFLYWSFSLNIIWGWILIISAKLISQFMAINL